jgi:hypothetical protein
MITQKSIKGAGALYDIVVDDVFAPVTARGDVIERVWEFDANRTRHARKDSMNTLRS